MIGIFAKHRGRIVATVVFCAVAACSSGSHSAKSTTTTTSATASTTSTTTAEQAAVIAAWRHYWDIYVAVGSEMKLPDRRLADVATGDELRQLGGAFLADQSQGHVIKGTIDLSPRVVRVDGTQAQLFDCYLSRILVYDRSTDQPIGAGSTNRTHVTATLQFVDGAWKVGSIDHDGDGCTAP